MATFPAVTDLSGLQVLAVLAVGAAAGFINVTAGGGSLLTLPLLILLGLPASVANGTNRVAIVAQNLVAVPTFRKGGVRGLRATGILIACALPGALVGAWAGASMPDALFRRALGVLMIALTVVIVMQPRKALAYAADAPARFRPVTLLAFALLGLYAGFVQAGIGFLIVLALAGLERFPLVRAHAFKVTFVLALQIVSLAVFASLGKVHWPFGLLLAAGLAIGGYTGARVALRSGERVLRIILVVGAVVLGLRMILS